MKFILAMKNTNLTSLFVIVLLLLISSADISAQNEAKGGSQTLREQFQEIIDKSETYTEYKVIRRTKLDQYSKSVQDTLNTNRSQINGLNRKVADQQDQISSLRGQITALEAQLADSEEQRNNLSFLGINLNKATYHIIVWVIIAALAVFGIIAYSSFMRSNVITTKTKKEYKELEVEYEDHKRNSHERQIKTGRELQTERNKVEELKAKLKAKTSGKS